IATTPGTDRPHARTSPVRDGRVAWGGPAAVVGSAAGVGPAQVWKIRIWPKVCALCVVNHIVCEKWRGSSPSADCCQCPQAAAALPWVIEIGEHTSELQSRFDLV